MAGTSQITRHAQRLAPTPSLKHASDKKHYTVMHSRKTGIFVSWQKVHLSVCGYAGGKFRTFRHRKDAEDWFLQQMDL